MAQSKRSDGLEDIEAQVAPLPTAKTQVDTEYSTSTRTKVAYLTMYFLCNVSLTIYNKLVLGKVSASIYRPIYPSRPGLSSLSLMAWRHDINRCTSYSSRTHGF